MLLSMKFTIFLISVLTSFSVFAQSDFYPQKDIESFLKLNSNQMRNYVLSLDIELYKFETGGPPDSDIVASDFLAQVPLVKKSDFNRFKDLFSGDVLGVFFSRHNSYYNVKKDTMLLSSEADTWTLAHELSHALIDQNRHKNGVVLEEKSFTDLANAKEDYEEAMSMYRNFGRFLSPERAQAAFISTKVWTKILIELLYAFELEEVKIERALRAMHESNPSGALRKYSYDRSPWYSQRNCQSAVTKSQYAKEVIEYFESILDSESKKLIDQDVQEYKKFVTYEASAIAEYCLLKK